MNALHAKIIIHNCQGVKMLCPAVDEWTYKIQYVHKVEYYSATKRNELPSYEKIWRKLNMYFA